MSYSVCKHGGKMCDGCMSCYDEKPFDKDYDLDEYDYDDEDEEDEDYD